jgi:hypothetical protein
MPTLRSRLELLELGERTLPSAVAPVLPTLGGGLAATVTAHPLLGAGVGTYHGPQVTIDAGTSFAVTGTATLRGLGSFAVKGSVQGVGFIASGRATGQLVLSNARGTITLALHGAVQTGFSQPPTELVYVVTAGTGAFSHVSGYGAVGMIRHPAPTAFGQPPSGVISFTFS